MKNSTSQGFNLSQLRRYLLASTLTLSSVLVPASAQAFTLNLLHFSDGESSLLPDNGVVSPATQPPTTFNYSGVSLFADLIDRQRNVSATDFDLLVTAGDNFLAGAQFEASLSLPAGQQFYDTTALELFNIDVGGIGNHEFDFGPDVLARFIDPEGDGVGFRPFVSANLVIPDSSPLKPLIQPSTVITKTVNGVEERVGVVGVTTPLLRSISSPGNVQTIGDTSTNPNFQQLVERVQAEVDNLTAQGIDKVVLVSHLQDLNEERVLATRLNNVDVIVAAGSDTRLANEDDPILPLAGEARVPSYPLIFDSATGQEVDNLAAVTGTPTLIVSTDGEYKYLGNLQVEFTNGEISSILEPGSGPKPNADIFGLTPRADLVSQVQEPVAAFVESLQSTVVAQTNVPLDSLRANVRARSTFGGSLIADAIRDAAIDQATAQGLDASNILVGIQNGGGIRNDRQFAPGDNITAFDTFDVLPFPNFVTVVQDITGSELLSILERSVSSLTAPDLGGGGQFLQLSGLEVVYDVTQPAQAITADGVITSLGSRIQSIFLAPGNDRTGQFIYDVSQGGFQLPSSQTLFDLATIDFTARGGDNFAALAAIPDSRKTILGLTYQQALENYLTENLGGVVNAADIPNGEGVRVRDITALVAPPTDEVIIVQPIPEPTTIAGVIFAGAGLVRLKRRSKQNQG